MIENAFEQLDDGQINFRQYGLYLHIEVFLAGRGRSQSIAEISEVLGDGATPETVLDDLEHLQNCGLLDERLMRFVEGAVI